MDILKRVIDIDNSKFGNPYIIMDIQYDDWFMGDLNRWCTVITSDDTHPQI